MSIILIRTLILFTLIVFSLRFMGKRQIGELQPSELVTTIMISNIAALPIEDAKIPLLNAMLPIFFLVILEVIISYISMKKPKFRDFAMGEPKVIIKNGVIDQHMLLELRISVGDLLEEMRQSNIFDVSMVQFAIIETNGKVSFLEKEITISEKDKNPPVPIITVGEVLSGGLKYCGKDIHWVDRTLKNEGIKKEDVFLMTCDENSRYTIIKNWR